MIINSLSHNYYSFISFTEQLPLEFFPLVVSVVLLVVVAIGVVVGQFSSNVGNIVRLNCLSRVSLLGSGSFVVRFGCPVIPRTESVVGYKFNNFILTVPENLQEAYVILLSLLMHVEFIVQTIDSHGHSDVLAVVTDRAMMMMINCNFISIRAVYNW